MWKKIFAQETPSAECHDIFPFQPGSRMLMTKKNFNKILTWSVEMSPQSLLYPMAQFWAEANEATARRTKNAFNIVLLLWIRFDWWTKVAWANYFIPCFCALHVCFQVIWGYLWGGIYIEYGRTHDVILFVLFNFVRPGVPTSGDWQSWQAWL